MRRRGTRPEVVTVCGSMRFFPQMLYVAATETASGVIVLAPFVRIDSTMQDVATKFRVDELHRHKIDLSARVLVVTDATGYYGVSTRGEISYAETLGVPVEFRTVTHTLDPTRPFHPEDGSGDGS